MKCCIEKLIVVECIPFKNFKEKISLTKKYNRKARIEIIDDKYIYVEIDNYKIAESRR